MRVPEYARSASNWPEHSFQIVHASGDPQEYKTFFFAVTRPNELQVCNKC